MSPNGSASNNSKLSAKRNTHRHKVENTNNSPTKTLEGCTESGSRGKKRGSPYKKLGEAAVQVIVNYCLNLVLKFVFCSGYLSIKILICILVHPLYFTQFVSFRYAQGPICKIELQKGSFYFWGRVYLFIGLLVVYYVEG